MGIAAFLAESIAYTNCVVEEDERSNEEGDSVLNEVDCGIDATDCDCGIDECNCATEEKGCGCAEGAGSSSRWTFLAFFCAGCFIGPAPDFSGPTSSNLATCEERSNDEEDCCTVPKFCDCGKDEENGGKGEDGSKGKGR